MITGQTALSLAIQALYERISNLKSQESIQECIEAIAYLEKTKEIDSVLSAFNCDTEIRYKPPEE